MKERFMHIISKYIKEPNGVILALYLFFVISIYIFIARDGRLSPAFAIAAPIVLVVLIFGCSFALKRISVLSIAIDRRIISREQKILWCIVFFMFSFGILFRWYLAYYPGAFSSEAMYQYKQAMSGQYNDWKPILQTLITFTLPLKLTGKAELIVLFQIIEYSFILTYMAYTIMKYTGIRIAVPALLYILLNPVTGNMAVSPCKDVTFAMFAVLLMTYGLQIHITDGGWLDSSKNILMFCFALIAATVVRHNAVLFTGPLTVAVFLHISSKRRFQISLFFLICFGLIKGCLYPMLEVEEEWYPKTRVLGLPMTMIGNTVKEAPESLDGEIKEFVYAVAPKDVWDEAYRSGSFNSIKWESDQAVIDQEGIVKVIAMAGKSLFRTPRPALKGLFELTDIVYSIDGHLDWNVDPYMAENDMGLKFYESDADDILKDYTDSSRKGVFRYLFWCIGIVSVVVLMAILCKCRFTEKEDWKKILFGISVLSYNFGTMLLLSGNDFRYFYLDFPICPIVLLLLFGKKTEQREKVDIKENYDNKISDKILPISIVRDNKIVFEKILIIVLILILSWFQIQLSCVYRGIFEMNQVDFTYFLLNIVTGAVFWIVIYVLINSLWVSGFIFSIFSCIISVVNYYVISFHDLPLTVMELGNFQTALNVVGEYNFDLIKVLPFFVILLIECCLVYVLKKIKSDKEINLKRILITKTILGIIAVFIFYKGYFSSNPIMSDDPMGWSWVEKYQKYGYMACTVRAAYMSQNYLEKPDSYYEGCVKDIEINDAESSDCETPDIILILNETFYDLSLVINIETDVPYLENIDSMDNTIRGYAVNPMRSTNGSEYELLTSNSLKLMPGIIPFNVIDMNGANSIVSHLKKAGYHTIGGHCSPAQNYNRGVAYPAMGFDDIYFRNDFVNTTFYGARAFETDESLYENVLSWMNRDNEIPQFIYLLTIQNHGEWMANERDLDIVHALNDFGEYDEQVDEYLSCISLSDQAFYNFTQRLKSIDRKVIVCMVGDHYPAFLGKIYDSSSSEDAFIRYLSVPYIIWANYDLEDKNDVDGETISMNYLVPTLLDIADVNISPYYQYMLKLKKEVPILTALDIYVDKDGSVFHYDETSKYEKMISDYFNLEYNNLSRDRVQKLFDAYD